MKRILFILAALFATAKSQTIQTIGAPTTTVVSRGNFRTDSIFYLPKRQKLPTDSGAVRYQISDSSVYYWSGFQWLKLGVNIDTSSMLSPYVRGSGTANYLPKFNASRSIVDSKVYESATNLMFNTTTPYFTTSGIGSFDINGSTASVLVLRKADTARGYWSHNGSTMDINNIAEGDIRFYTDAQLRGRFQTDGTFRLNSLTGTGTRSVVADANGVLSASSTPTDLIDTTYISTRAWRQKGIDSVSANVALKVNISDTSSMLTNYIRHAGNGLTKSGQALSVDTAAIATRARVQKGIDSVATLASAGVTSVATGYGLSGGTITTTGTIIVDSAIVASRLRVGKVVDSLALVKQNVLTNPVTGTGTTNYVPKFTGTSTIGNSSIFDNGTRVGIGMTSPGSKLHVLGAAEGYIASESTNKNGGSGLITWGRNSDSTRQAGAVYFVPSTTTPYIGLSGDGSQIHLAATSAGNIGIGNVAPAYKVDITGSLRNTANAFLATSSGSEVLLGTTGDSGNYRLQVNGNAYFNGSVATTKNNPFVLFDGATFVGGLGSTFWASANSSTDVALYATNNLWLYSNATRAAIFNTANELLLNTGTDAGDYKLQVSGNAYVTGTTVLAATSGNVGVGLTSPAAKFVVATGNFSDAGAISASTGIASKTSSSVSADVRNSFISQNYTSSNTDFSNMQIGFVNGNNVGFRSASLVFTSDQALAFRTGGTGTSSETLIGTEKIRMHSNGGLKFVGQSAAPTAEAGTVYYDTDDNKLKVYNGTTWVDLH